MRGSDRQLMAIAGHETPNMTSLYTRDRNRASLAESGTRVSNLKKGQKTLDKKRGKTKCYQRRL